MNDTIKQIIPYIIIGAILFFIVRVILKRFGLIKDKKKEIAKEKNISALMNADYFNPSFFKTVNSFNPMGIGNLKPIAEQINEAWGLFNDNEGAIYSAFGKLKCKTNISQLADYYFITFKRDLKSEILDKFSNSEQSKLMDIILNLPDR